MTEAQIVAVADLHIDGGRFGGKNPETGLRRAWESAHGIWTSICRYAIDQAVDAVVGPGDFYLNSWPKAEAVELLADGVRLLEEADVPLVVAPGNHELLSLEHNHRNPLEHLIPFRNVVMVREPQLVTLHSGVQIGMFPWPHRRDLLEKSEYDGLSPIAIDELVAARLAERIDSLADQADLRRGPVILAGHATVGDAVIGSSRRGSERVLADLFNEPVLALADVDRDPWQHVALGHIHPRQAMGERSMYLGSPDRLDFSDEHLAKAFSVITLPDDGSLATVEAVPTAARRFRTIEVPAALDRSDLANLLPSDPEGVLAKFVLPHEANRALGRELRRVAEGAGMWVVEISWPAPTRSNSALPGVAEDISPLEGFELWLRRQRDLAPSRVGTLRAKAAALCEASSA